MIYFTSDLHIYHRRIQEFCPTTRSGKDWEEMSEILLSNLERTLKPGDVLYNLGDVAFQGVDFCHKALSRIAATGVEHHLILGNHDHHMRKNQHLRDQCASVSHMKTFVIEKQMVVLCHFPLAHWESEETSFHLHGHCHGSYQTDGNILDVGIDNRAEADMMPWTWDEVKQYMKTVKPKVGHHGAS